MCVSSPQEKWSVLVGVRRPGDSAWPLSLPSALAQRFSVCSSHVKNEISCGQRADMSRCQNP